MTTAHLQSTPPKTERLAIPNKGRLRDLRPIVERNDSNGLSHAERIRDQIYDTLDRTAAAKQVEVLILKSPPFTAPPWVRVESWLHHTADSALTLRSSATLSVRPREFHRFPVEIDLAISDDKRNRTFSSLIDFQESDAQRLLDYLLFEPHAPRLRFRRCRAWPFQLWLPRNKPARLGVDPLGVVVSVLLIVGFITLGIGVGAILLLAAGLVAYFNGRRRRHVLSAGKPAQEPRQLIRLDSWQTLVKDLGCERDGVLGAIEAELHQPSDDGVTMANEHIWYWGVDGKEEREQLVVRFRRGIAFVHVYRYATDLFVGWDAHVNCGTWVEATSGSGYDKATRELCAVHTIEAGWHVPNEYDICDTNCLLERVHVAVSKVIKLKLCEHKIDQEVDFKILREPRQNIAGREAEGAKGASAISGVLSKIRRVG
jgi:hypothetical protein